MTTIGSSGRSKITMRRFKFRCSAWVRGTTFFLGDVKKLCPPQERGRKRGGAAWPAADHLRRGHAGGWNDKKVGAVDFGDRLPFDLYEATLRWYDNLLKGMANGVGQEKPVRIFVMGTDEWREEDDWPLGAQRRPGITCGRPSPRTACRRRHAECGRSG